ncbi:hypothetical protein [Porticoccus sp.]
MELNVVANWHGGATAAPTHFFRVTHDDTNYLPDAIADGYNSNFTNIHGTQYHLLFKYNEASPSGTLQVEAKTDGASAGNKTRLYNSKMYAIDLDALGTENTDWIYAENRTEVDDGTTGGAAVTFTPAAEQWVFMGFALGGKQTTTESGHGVQIKKDGAADPFQQNPRRWRHADWDSSTAIYPSLAVWQETTAASSQTWEAHMEGSSTGKEVFACIFGFRPSALTNSQIAYDAAYFQNPADAWEDEAGVTLTHTTDASAADTLAYVFMLQDQTNTHMDLDEGSGTSYYATDPDDTGLDTTFPSWNTLNAGGGASTYVGLNSAVRTGSLSAATARFRRRSGANFDTTGYDSLMMLLDIDTLTVATSDPAGGSSSVTLSAMGDISSTTRKQLAADAGVTLTSGEAVGQLQEIAQDKPDKEYGALRENILSDLGIV